MSTPTSKRRASEPDQDGPNQSPSDQSSSSERKINKHCLVCLDNGVVSLKHLDLSREIPSKTRVMGTQELFGARLSWGEAFSFFCLLKCGKVLPIEKYRDHDMRLQIMRSAFKYTLDDVQRATILGAESAELNAYLLGMARATQQKLRYVLYGMASNHFNEQVLLRHGLRPAAEVQKHLGLVGPHEHKGFMDM